MTAVAPNTSAMFVMFEPIALPTASPGLPPNEAIEATRISGAEVPSPTTVKPMTRGDTPRLRAVAEAPVTNKSALQINKPKPASMATKSIRIDTELPTTLIKSAMIHDNSQQNEAASLQECDESSIRIGALGWKHDHWLGEFYPEDLPEDWQLSYYSNEFPAVLVPENDWKENVENLDEWAEEVSDGFRFYFQVADECVPDVAEINKQLGDSFAGFVVGQSGESETTAMIVLADKSLREWRVWLEENSSKLKAIFLLDRNLSVKKLSEFKSLVEMLNL